MRLLYLNDYGNGEHAAGPLQDKGFLLCSLLAVLQSAIVLLRLTMGMSFKRHFFFFLSFSPPLASFYAPLFPPSGRVPVPRRARPRACVRASTLSTHRSRHKVNILHSKAHQSDWTRSVCLGRHNPIYVCNEVYSLRSDTMCSLQNAEARWPGGQVPGRTCLTRSVFQRPGFSFIKRTYDQFRNSIYQQ